jgi:hypothetical protein
MVRCSSTVAVLVEQTVAVFIEEARARRCRCIKRQGAGPELRRRCGAVLVKGRTWPEEATAGGGQGRGER